MQAVVPGEGVAAGVGVPDGVEVGEDEGGGVVGLGLGWPMITLPVGCAEGRAPTGGLGLVEGTSICPSLSQEAVDTDTRSRTARLELRIEARQERNSIYGAEFSSLRATGQWMNIASP